MNNFEYKYNDDFEKEFQYQLRDLLRQSDDDYTLDQYTPLEIRRDLFIWDTQDSSLNLILDSEEVKYLWKYFIVPRYIDSVIATSDIEYNFIESPTNTEIFRKIFGKFWRLFESILVSSYERFSPLIKIYKEQENQLMKQVSSKSETKSRINKVPHIKNVDPYDTEFTNEANTNEFTSSSDLGTPAQRLKEIRGMWYNLNEEWCEYFEPLFLLEDYDER